ncbi:MAG: hypothetical protein RPU39_13805 [Candidatus Sedimenticola sp. (ex Thyasira tokunagai)]
MDNNNKAIEHAGYLAEIAFHWTRHGEEADFKRGMDKALSEKEKDMVRRLFCWLP